MMQPIAWCVTSTLRSAVLFAIFFRADHIPSAGHLALPPSTGKPLGPYHGDDINERPLLSSGCVTLNDRMLSQLTNQQRWGGHVLARKSVRYCTRC